MKININLLALTAILALQGCAKTVWTNPNLSGLQQQKDLTECQRKAEIKNEPMQACMTTKGYHVMETAQQ